MIKLFSNIFEHSHSGQFKYPKALLKEAIERAVDGTDPRLRMMRGYAKTLRGPVLHAIDHVVHLVESLPEAVPVSRDNFANNPALASIFYSTERLEQIISRDAALREFRESKPHVHGPVNAVLAVRKKEKHVVGIAMVDGEMRKDVAKTTISFHQHRFVDPAQSEDETQRLLMRRLFDRLLGIALSRLVERQQERKDLAARKALLKCKLDVMERSGSLNDQAIAGERGQLQMRMEDIEQQLSALGPDQAVLSTNLAIIAEMLGRAERYLWLEETSICLDRYYVLQSQPSPSVPKITFHEFHDGKQDGILALIVKNC
ncbi:MAG: hypothetical protein ACR2P1_24095 [Pseudomonadales bacterium]